MAVSIQSLDDELLSNAFVANPYPTYERLRAGARTPEQVEALLAKLAISIVTPGTAATPG